jgi:hypothetical protein
MKKLETLQNQFPNEVNEIINKLYKEKFPHKKGGKTIYKFKAMGICYESNIFTKNYVNFLKDVSKLHSYQMFESTILKKYIYKSNVNVKQPHKIRDGFYVSGYSSTDRKIKHIKELCNILGLTLTELN